VFFCHPAVLSNLLPNVGREDFEYILSDSIKSSVAVVIARSAIRRESIASILLKVNPEAIDMLKASPDPC